jgi:hypothetical protein
MINKIISLFLILFCVGCSSRVKLDKPINLNYSNEQIVVDITLTHRSKNKFISGPESWYSFYGTMDSQLIISKERPDRVYLLFNGKKIEIYLDAAFGDVADFWDRSWWNAKGFRKNKIYIPLSDSKPDWENIKFTQIERGKEWMFR